MSDSALPDCLQIMQQENKMKKIKNTNGFLDKPTGLCYYIYRVKERQVLRLIGKARYWWRRSGSEASCTIYLNKKCFLKKRKGGAIINMVTPFLRYKTALPQKVIRLSFFLAVFKIAILFFPGHSLEKFVQIPL